MSETMRTPPTLNSRQRRKFDAYLQRARQRKWEVPSIIDRGRQLLWIEYWQGMEEYELANVNGREAKRPEPPPRLVPPHTPGGAR